MIKATAPAKIHLTLHVTGQRSDGLHTLDSLVAFVDVGDEVSIEQAAQSSLQVFGPFATGISDKEKKVLSQAVELSHLDMAVTLNKVVPSQSGLGDITASCAAVLRAATELGDTDEVRVADQMPDLDLAIHVASQSARVQGVGGTFVPIELPVLHMVLVNPRVDVIKRECFKELDDKNNPKMVDELPTWLDSLAFADWLTTQRNDLQTPAAQQAPDIAAVLVGLALTKNVLLTRMSGAGPTCFSLYPDREAADAAAQELASNNPWWWVKSASTMVP